MSKNKIKVKVCGTEFNILSEDNEEYTQKIASVVDRKMKQTLETIRAEEEKQQRKEQKRNDKSR